MFFKRKSKKTTNSNNQNLNKPNRVKPSVADFDYEAIKFNEFLTNDIEYRRNEYIKDTIATMYEEIDVTDLDSSPLGQRLSKDNKTMRMINDTVKNNLSVDQELFGNENIGFNNSTTNYDDAIISKPIVENYTITDDAKSFLKNQNTKVLLADDIEDMISNIHKISQEASAILNDTNRITRQLSSIDEIKMPSTKEFINSKHINDIAPPNNNLNTNRSEILSNITKNEQNEYTQPPLKTKALFNDVDSYTDFTDLDDLKPIQKEKEALRITKLNKRDI